MGRIRGCIVDSAPVAAPDPQVNDTASFIDFLMRHTLMLGEIIRYF